MIVLEEQVTRRFAEVLVKYGQHLCSTTPAMKEYLPGWGNGLGERHF
jgi:hypothetical protein